MMPVAGLPAFRDLATFDAKAGNHLLARRDRAGCDLALRLVKP